MEENLIAQNKQKKLNKGILIRDQKRAKNRKKMYTLKDEQIGLERLVKVKYPITKLVNGRWKTTLHYGIGTQKENRIYFDDGKFIYANRKGVSIKEIEENDKCFSDKRYKRTKQG